MTVDAVCDDCGEPNPARARFCLNCGTPFRRPGEAARKFVTVLFADVVDSTVLGEHLDPEPLRELLLSAFRRVEAVIAFHGGTVEKFIGDAVMAVFGIPTVHEDDALRAVRAADEMRHEIAAIDREFVARHGATLQLRIGVNSGEVMTGGGRQTLVTGDPVNMAARLEQLAGPGEVVLGPATAQLVERHAVLEAMRPVVLKGRSGRTVPHRLVALRTDAGAPSTSTDTPFVGRETERARLLAEFDAAVASSSARVVTVLGTAGVGKSRLVAECCAQWRERAAVAVGTCPAYGRGVTFWPLREAIDRMTQGMAGAAGEGDAAAALARLLPDVAERDRVVEGVLGLVGLLPESSEVDPSWAARRLLESISQRQPVVVVLDGAHWAEAGLLDLVEHVLRWWQGAGLLLVVAARPELLEHRPGWGSLPVPSTTLQVDGLDDDVARRLAGALLGPDAAPDAVDRIVTAAGGNPLFLEELAVDARAGGRAATNRLPDGVRTLLAARLDRLPPNDRLLLQRASVAGDSFDQHTLAVLTPERDRPDIRTHLLGLLREGLLHTRREGAVERYAFRHVLLREAAYESLPKRERLVLHATLGQHWEELAWERDVQLAEVVGHHFERAADLAREMGEARDDVGLLDRRAGSALADAGRRAHARGDVAGARNLLERAAARLEDTPRLPEVLADLGSAMTETGDLVGAGEVLDRAVEVATVAGDERVRTHAELFRLWQRSAVHPAGWTATARDVAARAVEVFTAAGDELGLARAWVVFAEIAWSACRFADVEDALDRATRHARTAGDRREEVENLAAMTAAGVEGPLPVKAALERCEAAIAAHPDAAALHARVHRSAGLLQAATGDREAIQTLDQSIAGFRDLGQAYWMAVTLAARGRARLLLDDPEGAERDLRSALSRLEELGDRSQAARAATLLARVRAASGDAAEAMALVDLGRSSADEEDLEPQLQWRVAAVAACLTDGDAAGAMAYAADARRLAADSDALLLRADIEDAVAAAADATGDAETARTARAEAASLRARKLGTATA